MFVLILVIFLYFDIVILTFVGWNKVCITEFIVSENVYRKVKDKKKIYLESNKIWNQISPTFLLLFEKLPHMMYGQT